MMKFVARALFLICLGAIIANASETNVVAIIPRPVTLRLSGGTFRVTPSTRIVVREEGLRQEAGMFNEELHHVYGFTLRVVVSQRESTGAIVLATGKNVKHSPEGYTISVTPSGIHISGTRAGVFYGLQTLYQMIPPASGEALEIPCAEIEDAPVYSWRGMHLDVGRHFFPAEFIKKYIDILALYKMNTFHWHLTEDQGWRIEIRRYPKLTKIGAWRSGSMIGPYSDQKFDSVRYGGFYTQHEIKEIVAYAKKRHVTIVPEIEMPGHAMAALASYPELSCTGGPFEVGKAWGVYDNILCPKETTFTFLSNVLAEVCGLFPGKYIHIGGDEAPKIRWKACEHCQALMKRHHLTTEVELQSYFIKRIEKMVNAKGKQLIGWDEILEGGLAPNAAVMSWRGVDGGIAAARQKHRVVMSPGSHCYFDYYQGTPQNEPLAIGGFTTVEKVYSYDPTPAELTPEEQPYVLGAQGNVWTEYISTLAHVEYMALPRMAALAEVVWSPKEGRDYHEFRGRLLAHFRLLDKLGLNYSKAIYEIKTDVARLAGGHGVTLALSTPFDSSNIRYTLDGGEPSGSSSLYRAPIEVSSTMTVRAGYFEGGKQVGHGLVQPFVVSKSTGKPVSLKYPAHGSYPGNGAFTLVDGVRGDTTRHGQNWLGWWGPDMDATVDLGAPQKISNVTIDAYDGEGSWIYLPRSVEVFVSVDSIRYTSVKRLSADEIHRCGTRLVMQIGDQTARFVRVVAENAGRIPEGKQGGGNNAWLFVDEIIVD